MQVTLGLGSSPIFHGRVQPELSYIPNPGVADPFTYVLSTNYAERPIFLTFQLTTDDNAADRQVGLQLLDPTGNVVAAAPVASTQPASTNYLYSFLASLSSANAEEATVVVSPLFNFVIPDSYQLATSIANTQEGDQISGIVYYRDRYSTGPDGYPQGGFNLPGLEAFAVETLNQG